MSKFDKISAIALIVIIFIFYLTFHLQVDPKTKLIKDTIKSGIGKACDSKGLNCFKAYIISGDINNKMKLVIDDIPINSTLCLDSGGGNKLLSSGIADKIRERKITTCLAERLFIGDEEVKGQYKHNNILIEKPACLSACSFVFLSANNRLSIGENTKLGVHREKRSFPFLFWSINGSEPNSDEPSKIEQKILSLTFTKGQRPNFDEFLSLTNSIPNKEIYILNQKQIRDLNIFTKKLVAIYDN